MHVHALAHTQHIHRCKVGLRNRDAVTVACDARGPELAVRHKTPLLSSHSFRRDRPAA